MKRLQTRVQFDTVLAQTVLASTEHFALHCSVQADQPHPSGLPATHSPMQASPAVLPDPPSIGAMVPKKWARRAVTRNLIRRQIYSLAEHHLSGQPGAAYVVRLRRSFPVQRFAAAASPLLKQAVRAQLQALLTKAVQQRAA